MSRILSIKREQMPQKIDLAVIFILVCSIENQIRFYLYLESIISESNGTFFCAKSKPYFLYDKEISLSLNDN